MHCNCACFWLNYTIQKEWCKPATLEVDGVQSKPLRVCTFAVVDSVLLGATAGLVGLVGVGSPLGFLEDLMLVASPSDAPLGEAGAPLEEAVDSSCMLMEGSTPLPLVAVALFE